MPASMKVDDEVSLSITILKVLDNGMSSVSIPSYSFPFSIDTPTRAKAGQKVDITGFVRRIDDAKGRLTVRIEGGGLVSADIEALSRGPTATVRKSR
ncbi:MULTISPECIES: hypothetical protein [unclassified Mesorhizobium]